MYSFEDRLNGEHLTLRPEFTAGVVRAAIEHNLTYDGPRRVWSMGPVFRHERPQRGRYRQFHQVDVEALGFAGPGHRRRADRDASAPVGRARDRPGAARAQLARRQAEERARHRADLIAYFEKHAEVLDARRAAAAAQPIRCAFSTRKNPAMQEMVAGAPRLIDYLGDASRAHFEGLQDLLARRRNRVHASIRAWCAASTTTT